MHSSGFKFTNNSHALKFYDALNEAKVLNNAVPQCAALKRLWRDGEGQRTPHAAFPQQSSGPPAGAKEPELAKLFLAVTHAHRVDYKPELRFDQDARVHGKLQSRHEIKQEVREGRKT